MAIRVLVGGLAASMAMGMWEMVVEAVVGQGFWAPVVYIAATLLRDLQSLAGTVQFDLIPVVLGLMGHMMNSVILAIPFALVVTRLVRSTFGLAVVGALFGVTVFVIMWFLVIPLIDPVMLQLNVVSFFLAHMMWGGALGVIVGWGLEQKGKTLLSVQPQRR